MNLFQIKLNVLLMEIIGYFIWKILQNLISLCRNVITEKFVFFDIRERVARLNIWVDLFYSIILRYWFINCRKN